MIRYTKIIDNKPVFSQVAGEDIITCCFCFCKDSIQKQVAEFLDDYQKELMIEFEKFAVKLEKYEPDHS